MPISSATINGVKLSDFTVIVDNTEAWQLPLYTITDFFRKYCGITLETQTEYRSGHKIVLGGNKSDESAYGRFETEIWFGDGNLHIGCANATMAQKVIYTFIHQYFKPDGSVDIILPSDGTAKFNSSAADDWDDANPEKILTIQDRIIRSCYKLQAILEYDTAQGKPFTYENKGYEATMAAARLNDNRTTNCVIVGNWAMKDAGFYTSGIYNHKYDGTFGYSFSGGSADFFNENFYVTDVRSQKKSVSKMVEDGELLPGDIIGFESHNQTILPLGCAFDGGRGLNTSRPAAGADFLRWVGANPYPTMVVGFIFRSKDAK